jgi:hypothetical protein
MRGRKNLLNCDDFLRKGLHSRSFSTKPISRSATIWEVEMPAQTARRTSRTARQAAAKARALAVVTETPEPERKPEDIDIKTGELLGTEQKAKRPAKPELPTAAGDLGARQVTYWFPKLTLSDGTVIECVHSAMATRRRLRLRSACGRWPPSTAVKLTAE